MDDLYFAKKLLGQGDKEGAFKELALLLRNDPKKIPAWFLLAKTVDDEKKKADCYRQVLRTDPNNELARVELVKLTVKPTQPIKQRENLLQSNQTKSITLSKEQIKTKFKSTDWGFVVIGFGLVIIDFLIPLIIPGNKKPISGAIPT